MDAVDVAKARDSLHPMDYSACALGLSYHHLHRVHSHPDAHSLIVVDIIVRTRHLCYLGYGPHHEHGQKDVPGLCDSCFLHHYHHLILDGLWIMSVDVAPEPVKQRLDYLARVCVVYRICSRYYLDIRPEYYWICASGEPAFLQNTQERHLLARVEYRQFVNAKYAMPCLQKLPRRIRLHAVKFHPLFRNLYRVYLPHQVLDRDVRRREYVLEPVDAGNPVYFRFQI